MNYCKRKKSHWVCTANALTVQESCDFFWRRAGDTAWCEHNRSGKYCNSKDARRAKDGPAAPPATE